MNAAARKVGEEVKPAGKLALSAALVVFLVLATWQSRTFMVWAEETMVHSSPAVPVIAAGSPGVADEPRFEPSCTAPDEKFGLSDGRPRAFACAFGRRWPVMIAPYLGGFPYWPAGLLLPLHHGNVLALRLWGLLIGLTSLVLTYAVVRRLRGERLAGLSVLSMALTPAFIAVHSTLVEFETLPWMFLIGAVLVLVRQPGLFGRGEAKPAAETRALLFAALLTGLSVITNLKMVLLVVPMLMVAWRLGVRLRAPRRVEVGGAAFVFVLPLLVLVPTLLGPAGGYSDKASGAPEALLRNLRDPLRIGPYTRDLVVFWSDVGEFLSRPLHASHPNYLAIALAAIALVFTWVGMVRVLRRKEGCPVTAAVGACLAVHLVIVALLYDHYPANFAPLHSVFGLAGAVTLEALLSRVKVPAVRAAVAIAWLAPFVVSIVMLIEAMKEAPLPSNVTALQATVSWLDQAQRDGARLVNTTSMLTGVVDSLSDERFLAVQAQNYIDGCGRGRGDSSVRDQCMAQRFERLLGAYPAEGLRFVMAVDPGAFGGVDVAQSAYLTRAGVALGREVVLEQGFTTPGGVRVLEVYRVAARP